MNQMRATTTMHDPSVADVTDVAAVDHDEADLELVGRRIDLRTALAHAGGSAPSTHRAATVLRANLSDRSARLMVGTFLGAQLADMATTSVALQRAGLVESNPLFRTLFHALPSYANLIKLFAAIGVALVALCVLAPPRSRHVLIFAAALSLVAPVLNSLRLLGIS